MPSKNLLSTLLAALILVPSIALGAPGGEPVAEALNGSTDLAPAAPVVAAEQPSDSAVSCETEALALDPWSTPASGMETAVIWSCPADGSICFDGDLCRAQCRQCGIELGACFLGLCRCIDT